ncbi:MAG: hypothetical protein R2702_15845 [Acidimicrobiales bacterium]
MAVAVLPEEGELTPADFPDDALDDPADDAAQPEGPAAPSSAPLGFGGVATSAPLPPPSVDDDDGPAAPPTGFTGGGRS